MIKHTYEHTRVYKITSSSVIREKILDKIAGAIIPHICVRYNYRNDIVRSLQALASCQRIYIKFTSFTCTLKGSVANGRVI